MTTTPTTKPHAPTKAEMATRLRKASDCARKVFTASIAGGRSPQSLAALMRSDYRVSQDMGNDPDTISTHIITYAQRTFHASWLEREHCEMDRALLEIAKVAEHKPELSAIFTLARQAMSQQMRDRFWVERDR